MNDAFDGIVGGLDNDMIVVTAYDGRQRSGCLVGFHTQVSMDPRRWLACISKVNHTHRVALGADILIVHFLHADQLDLAVLFGAQTDDRLDKFARCLWRPGPDGCPLLAECDWIAGRVIQRIDAGDHTAHVLDIVAAGDEYIGECGPLGFQEANAIPPGHPA
jgi:flavin reductase (DIM6/NTAB) family NADH-FMN oxidoreductase RutF